MGKKKQVVTIAADWYLPTWRECVEDGLFDTLDSWHESLCQFPDSEPESDKKSYHLYARFLKETGAHLFELEHYGFSLTRQQDELELQQAVNRIMELSSTDFAHNHARWIAYAPNHMARIFLLMNMLATLKCFVQQLKDDPTAERSQLWLSTQKTIATIKQVKDSEGAVMLIDFKLGLPSPVTGPQAIQVNALLETIDRQLSYGSDLKRAADFPARSPAIRVAEGPTNSTSLLDLEALSYCKGYLSELDFEWLSQALGEYVAKGTFPSRTAPVKFKGRPVKKKVGWAIKCALAGGGKSVNLPVIEFAQRHLSPFSGDVIDSDNYRNCNLYKYFTSKQSLS